MIIKGKFFRFPRTRFATKVILVIFFLIFFQTIILLKTRPSINKENIKSNVNEGIDLSYADIDIDNLEGQALEDLSNGNIPDDSDKVQFREDSNDNDNDSNRENEYVNQRGSGYANQRGSGYSNQRENEYANQRVNEYANQRENEYANQRGSGYANQRENEYANQRENEYANQREDEYANQRENEYANQRENEYANQRENEINEDNNEESDEQRNVDIDDMDPDAVDIDNADENYKGELPKEQINFPGIQHDIQHDIHLPNPPPSNNNDNNDYPINNQININNPLPNVEKEEADKAFNKENENLDKPKGWKLDEKWEWCRNISIVYTWVNGSDPHHQEIKSHYNGGVKKADQRDRSMDELRYSLRSLEKNLPWHEGTIYIVSPNQIPYWLNLEHPRIKVIDQADLLPPSANPTFNSFSIEFYLDKIPGLTERFIQLNDDYFFKRYIHPSFFFSQKRFPNFYYGRTHVHKGFHEADQISSLGSSTWIKKYWGSVFHTNGVIKEKYGDEAHIVMLQHAPYVWYRDIFEPMRQFYGHYLAETLTHKFRHSRDLIPTYAHQQFIINVASKPGFRLSDHTVRHPELEFGYFPHKYASKTITEYGYRALSRNTVKNYIRFGTVLDDKLKSLKLFNIIKSGPYLMFNLNDDYTMDEPGQWLLSFMNEMFPSYSSFENDAPKDADDRNKINLNDYAYVHIK